MAEQNGNAEDRRPTERVILKHARVLVIPDGVEPEKLGEAIRLLMPARGRRNPEDAAREAWIEVDRQTAASKVRAIELYAGKPGTPDAKVGTFRAPTATAWRGAVIYTAPPAPLVERSVIE